MVFPEDDEDLKKRRREDVPEDENGKIVENAPKKRRVRSFREEVVDDSEGEADDFFFNSIAEVTEDVS